ncbi:MAG: outer membrane lipoprotein carrier protein LolA [Acidobacteria bacterium]|nr:outer membrane lipoprotein carrier protein LolA [Acidobacteriota bacterium]
MWSVPRLDVLGALAATCILATPQQQALAPGVELLIGRIQEKYRQTELQARFVQRRLSRLGSVMTTVEGDLYIRTPGRMRWEYRTSGQLLVAGGPGRETYLYLPEDNQVQVIDSDLANTSEMPILYLTGRGNLRRDFDIQVVEWGVPLSRGNVQLELRPRRSGATFERLILEVDPLQATITRLVTYDNLRNTLDYQFYDLQFDPGLSDELFEFDIPEGAYVIHIGG